MARLTDPDILERYKQVLTDWAITGAVELTEQAIRELRATLEGGVVEEGVEGVTVQGFKKELYQFVCNKNGEIDQVKENRQEWRELWEWHYDLRPTIKGVKLYVETRLYPDSFASRDEPRILVVRVKLA
jgi:predicted lipid-binding transport protein (Tim44 family)